MKKLILFIAGITLSLTGMAQSWNYAVSLGGRSNVDGATAIAKDAAGNMYVTGEFEGTALFGTSVFTTLGFADQFLSKYNAAGVHQWTVQIGALNNVMGAGAVAVDAAGYVYVTGNYSFYAIFNGITYNANGLNDSYIAKYSPNGNFIWVQTISAPGSEKTTALQTLGTNVYLAGAYTQPLSFGNLSLPAPASGFEDAFLIKMDSSGTGIWVNTIGGSYDDRGTSLSVSSNIIYWGGYFKGIANFNGTTLTSGKTTSNVYYDDMFIVKLDQSGTQTWAAKYGGTFREAVLGISQDTWGNALATGLMYGTTNFGNGISITEAYGNQPPAGNGDACVFKANGADGTCLWARHIRSSANYNEVGVGISTDPGGSSYVIGTFNNVNTIFGSTATQTGTSLAGSGGNDAFLAKYDLNGTLRWVIKTGGTNNERGFAAIWDANGFVNVAGNFTGTITLGTPISAPNLTASVFLARYDGLTTGINETPSGEISFGVFPNPSDDFISISSSEGSAIDKVEIHSVTGAKIQSDVFPFGTTELGFNISNLPSGIYFIHAWSGSKRGVRKIQVN